MSTIEETLQRVSTITFDCYGTLVDWAGGLAASFEQILGPQATDRMDELFREYVAIEATIESGPYRSYREVLCEAVKGVALELGLDLPPGRAHLLAEMLPSWKPFPDANDALRRLKERYRLGVLSNIDRDLFEGTARHFDVAFDFVITAEDVRSYKPGPAHFQRCLETYGPPESILHVAQSLYHDGVPTNELGVAYVWINRYGDSNETDVMPLAEYPDLESFADVACDG